MNIFIYFLFGFSINQVQSKPSKSPNPGGLIKVLKKFSQQNKRDCMVIGLDIEVPQEVHGEFLVVHKTNDKVTYIFCTCFYLDGFNVLFR